MHTPNISTDMFVASQTRLQLIVSLLSSQFVAADLEGETSLKIAVPEETQNALQRKIALLSVGNPTLILTALYRCASSKTVLNLTLQVTVSWISANEFVACHTWLHLSLMGLGV